MTARVPRNATVGVVLCFLASGAIPAGAAQAAASLHDLLARPLSPGSVALLVEHASDARVVARWSEALKDPRPAVRATAARAINVTYALPLAESLTAAHAVEADPVARADESAALAALADAGALAWRPPSAPPRPATWRTASGYPPALVPDVIKVSGCQARKKQDFHGGQVTYGPDGRPRQIAILEPTRVPAACEEAARALLFLSLAPPEAVGLASRTDLLIVPFAGDAIACMGEDPPGPQAKPVVPGGLVVEPRKIRHVAPWYPEPAKNRRAQGTVIVEATIGRSGCIASVTLLRSVDPQLDVAALVTVAQWRYSPSLIDGVAVPVLMNITITFRLS
jgi:TonB family protein